jgi:A/G-specific adenine glycosylase
MAMTDTPKRPVTTRRKPVQPAPIVTEPKSVLAALLAWYDRSGRDLPWRTRGGLPPDPYPVWLSEVMLQQTTVRTVAPYFQAFLARWPTIADLAAAPQEEVLQAWSGLGYYARARNLHACAQVVTADHAGMFPTTAAELAKLPGIGAYTSAAIAAIAFDEAATPVDGNIERVVARLFAVETPMPAAKPALRTLAATLTPSLRPGDYAQAMMDLGATICTPRNPSCLLCPLERFCQAREKGIEASLPVRKPKPTKPDRFGHAFVVLAEDGQVLLRKRPETGLLAGMLEVPTTEWLSVMCDTEAALRQTPISAHWWRVPGSVVHVFTHFRLEMVVLSAVVPVGAPLTLWARQQDCRWVHRSKLAGEALPTLMRKIIDHASQTSS